MIAILVRNRLACVSICDKILNATEKTYVVVRQLDDASLLELSRDCLCQGYFLLRHAVCEDARRWSDRVRQESFTGRPDSEGGPARGIA